MAWVACHKCGGAGKCICSDYATFTVRVEKCSCCSGLGEKFLPDYEPHPRIPLPFENVGSKISAQNEFTYRYLREQHFMDELREENNRRKGRDDFERSLRQMREEENRQKEQRRLDFERSLDRWPR